MRKCLIALALLAAGVGVYAQQPPQQPPQPPKQEGILTPIPQSRDVIRRTVDLVTTDVIVRDPQGQFISTLGKADFEVLEDGVKQDLVTFVLTHGGRVLNDVSAPPPPVQEGILLPPPRPTNDV